MDIFYVWAALPMTNCEIAFVVQALNRREAIEMTRGQWGDHDAAALFPYVFTQKLGVVTADFPQVQKIVLVGEIHPT